MPLELADLQGTRWEGLEVLVDTGSTFTAVPRAILEGLGVRPARRQPFELADGRVAESDVGDAMVRVQGRQASTPVIFAEPGEQPLLGAVTLESLLLAVDPVHQVLIPVRGLRMTNGPLNAGGASHEGFSR